MTEKQLKRIEQDTKNIVAGGRRDKIRAAWQCSFCSWPDSLRLVGYVDTLLTETRRVRAELDKRR